jgi:hypothetical protein
MEKERVCANAALIQRGIEEQQNDTTVVGWKGFLQWSPTRPLRRHICKPDHKRDHHTRAGQDPPTGIMNSGMTGFAVGDLRGAGRQPKRP